MSELELQTLINVLFVVLPIAMAGIAIFVMREFW